MNRKAFIKNTSLMALGSSLLPIIGHSKEMGQFPFWNNIVIPKDEYDAIVIGGSYAGLSAALTLARCLRRVLVIDTGKPRNRFAEQAHNALLMDGLPPSQIQKTATQQLSPYQSYLDLLNDEATDARQDENKFIVTTKNSGESKASFLVFATGAIDELPNIEGLSQQWGRNVHHCPYCHGFESKDGKTLLLTKNFEGLELLSSLQHWSNQLTVAFQTVENIPENLLDFMKQHNIEWTNQHIVEVRSHENGKLKDVVYEDGSIEEIDHIYLKPKTTYQTQLAEKLGCEKDDTQRITTDDFMLTSQAGIYATGDISSKSMGQIIWSANSGLMAGVDINNTMIASMLKK